MKADIYKTKAENTYLFLPQGNPFSPLPQAVLDQCGSLQFFKTVELGSKMIGADPDAIQADFQKQGYSIRGAEVVIAFAA